MRKLGVTDEELVEAEDQSDEKLEKEKQRVQRAAAKKSSSKKKKK